MRRKYYIYVFFLSLDNLCSVIDRKQALMWRIALTNRHFQLLLGPCINMTQVRDDVVNFLCYCRFVKGIHQSPGDSPKKGQWHGALMFYLICAWTNGWANNRDAGDLRRHRVHGITLMITLQIIWVRHHNASCWMGGVCVCVCVCVCGRGGGGGGGGGGGS